MAIFGKNGLQAAALYLATLWAVYGQKDAGFKKDEEKRIVAIASRKNREGAQSSDKKTSLKQIRALRYENLVKTASARPGSSRVYGKDYERGSEFQKAYVELPYSR